MRIKLFVLAVTASFLIAAVPALAQDTTDTTGSYTTTTPTVTTPTTSTSTTPTTKTDTNAVEPAGASGTAGTGSDGNSGSQLAKTGGGNTWFLLAIGGLLAIGSAALLARERRPRRNR